MVTINALVLLFSLPFIIRCFAMMTQNKRQGRNILVVDRSYKIIEKISSAKSNSLTLGNVRHARSYMWAMEILRNEEIDLVLINRDLSEIAATTIAQTIREEQIPVKLVIVGTGTMHASIEAIAEQQIQADHYIQGIEGIPDIDIIFNLQ